MVKTKEDMDVFTGMYNANSRIWVSLKADGGTKETQRVGIDGQPYNCSCCNNKQINFKEEFTDIPVGGFVGTIDRLAAYLEPNDQNPYKEIRLTPIVSLTGKDKLVQIRLKQH